MTSLSPCGKISFGIYWFILLFGGYTTLLAVVQPIAAADCMSSIFNFSNDVPMSDAAADQLVYFKAMGRMTGMLGTMFLIAVFFLGHSTLSCCLLLVWGSSNFLNFGILIPNDYFHLHGSGSDEIKDCMNSTSQAVFLFAVLETIGVLCSLVEDHFQRSSALSNQRVAEEGDVAPVTEATSLTSNS